MDDFSVSENLLISLERLKDDLNAFRLPVFFEIDL